MAMSQSEIEALMNGLLGDDETYCEDIKTIKYDGDFDRFFKSKSGYETEDEAMFHFYHEKIGRLKSNIKAKHDDILRDQKTINDILENHYDLLLKFSEEML